MINATGLMKKLIIPILAVITLLASGCDKVNADFTLKGQVKTFSFRAYMGEEKNVHGGSDYTYAFDDYGHFTSITTQEYTSAVSSDGKWSLQTMGDKVVSTFSWEDQKVNVQSSDNSSMTLFFDADYRLANGHMDFPDSDPVYFECTYFDGKLATYTTRHDAREASTLELTWEGEDIVKANYAGSEDYYFEFEYSQEDNLFKDILDVSLLSAPVSLPQFLAYGMCGLRPAHKLVNVKTVYSYGGVTTTLAETPIYTLSGGKVSKIAYNGNPLLEYSITYYK